MEYIIGIVLGVLGALLMNIGKGVQKQKVHVLKQGRKMFSSENRMDAVIWIIGIAMTSSATIPYTFSLKFTQSPSIISSLTGIGLVGLVLYAVFVIKEKIGPRDMAGILLILCGTSVLGYMGAGNAAEFRVFADSDLIVSITGMSAIFLVPGLFSLKFKRIHGVAFGLLAGVFLGSAIFMGDTALLKSNGSILDQLKYPYPYIAILLAISALTVTQLAFFRGRALEVIPCINSAAIITPVIYEITIYNNIPDPSKVAVIMFIVMGVIILSTGSAAQVASGEPAAEGVVP